MRLNGGAILFGVLAAIVGFPTAIVATTAPAYVKPAAVEEKLGVEVASLVTLPEFVPVTSFDEFVLASREYVAVTPSARRAAEALSERFSLPTGGGGFPRPAMQEDPKASGVPSVADDPKASREAKAAAAAAVENPPEPAGRAERATDAQPRIAVREKPHVQRRRVSSAEKVPAVKPVRSGTRIARLSGTTEDSMLGR